MDTNRICPKSIATRIELSQPRGFTLLELLVVTSILSVIAGLAVVTYGDVDDQSKNSTALSEMKEIQKALIQFKRDTGYFPGQGPFRLTATAPNAITPLRNHYIHTSDLPPQATASQEEWFNSPANFWLLFGTSAKCPLYKNVHPLEFYSVDSGRGWRGPYINSMDESDVVISGNFLTTSVGRNPFGPDSNGNIANPLPPMPTVYDPWKRPYLFFLPGEIIDPDSSNGATNNLAILVSLGPDGQRDNGTADDDDLYLKIPN